MRSARDVVAVFTALRLYRRAIVPRVRSELRRWEGIAEAIPNPVLRGYALAALREKGLNAEATAVFATLAPRMHRIAAIKAMVTFQVAVDYLDSLGEQPVADKLANGLQLHLALIDALSPGAPAANWYSRHPQDEDGGYLEALVMACRKTVRALPSHATVLAVARQAASRCGEGQSQTHAAASGDTEGLKAWVSGLEHRSGYLWWEMAAGASSSVAVHALIAAAANPGTTAEEAALLDAAYFPSVGALTVLLDDLIDRDEDLSVAAHNYMAYYGSNLEAAERLALIALRARAAMAKLRQARRHGAILVGVAGFYLSAPGADTSYARPVRSRLIESLGFPVLPILAAMRLRRRG